MGIEASVTGQPQITATVTDEKIDVSVGESQIAVSVGGGVGPTGGSGVIAVTAPVTNSGTSTAANIGLAVGSGLSVSSGTLVVTPGTYATLVEGKVPTEQLPPLASSWNDLSGKPVGDEGDVLTYVGGEWVAAAPAGAFLPLSGGEMDTDASIILNDGASAVQIAGNSVNVALVDGDQHAVIEYTGLTVHNGEDATILGDGSLSFPNGTSLAVGSYDSGYGGYGGISLVCAAGYELNWQAGRLRNVLVGGDGTPQTIYSDSTLAWRNPGLPGDLTVNGDGVTFPDSSQQTTAYIPTNQPTFDAVNAIDGAGAFGATLNGFGVAAYTDGNALTTYYGNGITFADSSFQDTAWTGTVAAGDVTGLADVATSGAYADLTGLPTLGTASSQDSSAFAAASHSHAASAITSGTLDIARIPTGSSSTTVCVGNDSRLSPEVLEYATSASFPATGSTARIYVATDASRAYRWTGSEYVEVGPAGGYLPSHVHSAADITSGTIAPARLGSGATSSLFLRGDSIFADPMSYATLLQSQNGTASPASTPANVYQQLSKWKYLDFSTHFGATVVGSGSVFTNMIVQIQSGSTANSSYLLRLPNEYYTTVGYGNAAGGYSGSTYWTRPQVYAFRINPNLGSANGVFRLQFGKAQGTSTVGRMANQGIGVELQWVNSTTFRLWLLAHNGTTLNAVDTAVSIRQNSVYDFVLSSDAGGNVTALVNDGAVTNYTIIGGPTTGGLGGITAEILNGTDAVSSSVHMYRALFYTSLS